MKFPILFIDLLQQFAQSRRRYVVEQFVADHEIGTLLALVLAQPTR
jgi:hypothetical protein